ncbi:MAG: hypothetical protein HC800_16115 [Phormidesmis sp. RL_2_1]|nr:hypothetical protein [Phormidesmis sp. RL_2_1]
MTVIAARKNSDAIIFAADSLISDGYVRSTDADMVHSKLFQHNSMIIGTTGYCYEGTLMELFSRNHKPVDAARLSIIDFLIEFREWVSKKDSGYKPSNGFLIAFESKIFCVYGGLEVYEVPQFEAIGAGKDFAKTALYLGHTPREAVEVACKLSLHCSEPISEISVAL